jgi:hypothetical protein
MSDLTQTEADYLFDLDKIPKDQEIYSFPNPGEKLIIPLISVDKREEFLFDMYRSTIRLKKITYQKRARKVVILRRLDIEGSVHKNPEASDIPLDILKNYNGLEVPCPHMHLYIEGFNLKWAVPAGELANLVDDNLYENMEVFLDYCNVRTKPAFQGSMF